MRVDPILSRLAYRCHPDGCPEDRTCCVGLAVQVSRREVRAVDSLMDELSRLVPSLRDGDCFENVFEPDGSGLVIEPRDEEGTCPFLFRRQGRALCAIHSVAIDGGQRISDFKPRACRHWPLTIEIRRGAPVITIHPEAERIGCVAPLASLPGQPTVRDAFAEEIAELQLLDR